MRLVRVAGFSLLELMIAVAIVAVVVALAFPSFEDSMRRNRVAAASNELIASLSLARMEALRSPGGAVLCTSSDGSTCGGGWGDGWIVWVDANGDGQPGGTDDRILRRVQGRDQLSIAATSPGGETLANRIAYDNRGRVDTSTRRITVRPASCPAGELLVQQIDVSLTGQARASKVACS